MQALLEQHWQLLQLKQFNQNKFQTELLFNVLKTIKVKIVNNLLILLLILKKVLLNFHRTHYINEIYKMM
jgi:hypothetical protein